MRLANVHTYLMLHACLSAALDRVWLMTNVFQLGFLLSGDLRCRLELENRDTVAISTWMRVMQRFTFLSLTHAHTQAILLLFALRPITRRSQALDSPPAKCNETGDRSGECRSAECDAIRIIVWLIHMQILQFSIFVINIKDLKYKISNKCMQTYHPM